MHVYTCIILSTVFLHSWLSPSCLQALVLLYSWTHNSQHGGLAAFCRCSRLSSTAIWWYWRLSLAVGLNAIVVYIVINYQIHVGWLIFSHCHTNCCKVVKYLICLQLLQCLLHSKLLSPYSWCHRKFHKLLNCMRLQFVIKRKQYVQLPTWCTQLCTIK